MSILRTNIGSRPFIIKVTPDHAIGAFMLTAEEYLLDAEDGIRLPFELRNTYSSKSEGTFIATILLAAQSDHYDWVSRMFDEGIESVANIDIQDRVWFAETMEQTFDRIYGDN